jgi:hypothetical protein
MGKQPQDPGSNDEPGAPSVLLWIVNGGEMSRSINTRLADSGAVHQSIPRSTWKGEMGKQPQDPGSNDEPGAPSVLLWSANGGEMSRSINTRLTDWEAVH